MLEEIAFGFDIIRIVFNCTIMYCRIVREKNITVFDCEKQFIKVTQYFDFLDIFFPLSCYSNEKPEKLWNTLYVCFSVATLQVIFHHC